LEGGPREDGHPPTNHRHYIKRIRREEGIMANHTNVNEASWKLGRRARRATAPNTSARWRPADAARFFFKGQCYDAGSESDTTCSFCAKYIRLVYILKVVESHSCAQEVGKLNVGECCFEPIEAVNEKLYRQLLAAAVNLRTYMEAIERDQRIFETGQQALPGLEVLRVEEDLVQQLFEGLLSDGGDHA
jgi:hypothetical protein